MEKFKELIEKNKLTFGIATVLVALIVLTGGFYAYMVMQSQVASGSSTDTSGGVQQAAAQKSCGELVADNNLTEGPSPLKVSLKAKVDSTADQNHPVCKWSIDGAALYDTYVVDGNCVFGKDPIVTKGEHTVKYDLDGKSCSASKKIIVR